ncbi:uncharacterized protein [Clytia hemisphaerica]|uniref:Fibrinogen C-terminal domain-containing protein n=1 Tax=Clytia hemisphaerica TaxID=252671 RepID=A0A7M5WIK2_9CNID
MKFCYSIFTYFIFIIFRINLTFGNLHRQFSPNIRYHQPTNQSSAFNYSFINVKKLKGYILSYTSPLADFEVANKTKCVKECVKTEGLCKSINLITLTTDGYQCQILAHDIYTTPRNLITQSDSTHYIITNKCMKSPCGKDEKCVPNYIDNTFNCYNKPSSCSEVKQLQPLATSGFFNITLNGKRVQVYCDMHTDGGGWMMVGNYSITQNNFSNPLPLPVGDIESLDQVSTGNFILNSTHLPVLEGWSPIKEVRFFCYKPSVGETMDFVTSQTLLGINFKNYLIGKFAYTSSWLNNAQAPTAFQKLPDDDSSWLMEIYNLGIPNVKKDTRLWNHIAWLSGLKHYGLYRDRRECGDYNIFEPQVGNLEQIGKWRFYVR